MPQDRKAITCIEQIGDRGAEVPIAYRGKLPIYSNGTGYLQGILRHDCSWKKGLCLDDRGTFS